MATINADACAASNFRYGRWQAASRASALAASLGTCGNLTYANASCTRALSVHSLCEALGHSGVLLMVGDSLMLKMWEALLQALQRSGVHGSKFDLDDCRAPPRSASARAARAARASCGQCCCKSFSLPCGGAKHAQADGGAQQQSVRVRFVRHNHLLGSFLPHANAHLCPKCAACADCAQCVACRRTLGARTLCDVWRDATTLNVPRTTLVLGTGSHVLEVPAYNASGAFEARADALAELLSGAAGVRGRAVYVLSTWGEQQWQLPYAGPTAPEPPHPTYAWDRIPAINAAYAAAMRRAGVPVVDPTLAASQRRDCRLDYMHSAHGVYAASTWRMLQAAIGRLPRTGE